MKPLDSFGESLQSFPIVIATPKMISDGTIQENHLSKSSLPNV